MRKEINQPSDINHQLLVIVGPTASGKSALALEIARKFDGEIICADSRTVYKGMDIGTAKPTMAERAEIPHHLLDVVDPDQNFSVADFKRLAEQAIKDIQLRNKLPILVGGSGLYVDAVIFNYGFSEPSASRDLQNPRHLSKNSPRIKSQISPTTSVVGITVERYKLAQRIATRIEEMVDAGLVEEVSKIQDKYPGSKALLTPGYKAFAEYLNGNIDLEEAKALFIKNDMQLAKRQTTWFKRNLSIQWLNDPSSYVDSVTTLLNKKE
jgi:tRNA dimethylallyltransferase